MFFYLVGAGQGELDSTALILAKNNYRLSH